MAAGYPTCACGCGVPVRPRSPHGGRNPKYATASCRVRAYRQRKAATQIVELEPFEGALQTGPIELTTASVDEQLERALLEAHSLGTVLMYLGTVARPQFSWRCIRLGEAILVALRDSFPELGP